MKAKSVAGHKITVSNLDKSIKFYESLGFVIKTNSNDTAYMYLNWYWIELNQGSQFKSGSNIYLSVDNVDAAFAELTKTKVITVTEPHKTALNYEFTIADPDGYHLTFFKRK